MNQIGKFKLLFLNNKGEYKEASVHTKPASNEVRKSLQVLERELNVYTTNFTKTLSEKHKEVFEYQQQTKGDILKALEMHETITVEELTQVMDLASDLENKQVEILIKEIKAIIDIPKSKRLSNLVEYQVDQLNLKQGEFYNFSDHKSKSATVDNDEIENEEFENDDDEQTGYDFWNNQDLGLLAEQKKIFFRRTAV